MEEGALVRDSIVCHGAVIRSGAVVDHAIIDKEVQVGSGATVGVGDNSVVNRARPDIVKSGISIVGKRAMIPPGMTVGRNVIIGPGVEEELAGLAAVESGETVLPEQMPLHLFV